MGHLETHAYGQQVAYDMPADWPRRKDSAFLQAAGLNWHYQSSGDGPVLLLLHGAGASTHSWHGSFEALAKHCRVVALDLPGHGLTERFVDRSFSLQASADGVAAFCAALPQPPTAIVGHSAGAAIALQMRLSAPSAFGSTPVMAINPALLPFNGFAGVLFPAFAKLAAQSGLMRALLKRRARDRRQLQRVIEGTGSSLSASQLSDYLRLMQQPDHVRSVLSMMANWRLEPLLPAMRRTPMPLHVWFAENDKAVPPHETHLALQAMPDCHVEHLSGLGHLAHEEAPDQFSCAILEVMGRLKEQNGSNGNG
ncbi:MAG: alpha/beta fold hydrolase BchO [Woeseiaceae bacterium]